MNELGPGCTLDTFSGTTRLTLKDRLDEEAMGIIASGKFDYIKIRDGDWCDISRLVKYKKNIKKLIINTDNLDWDTISELSYIEDLSIDGLSKCNIKFKNFNKLKRARIYWNEGYDETFNNLPSIEKLRITRFKHTDLEKLGCMDNLKRLQLVNCRKLESLKNIENFKNLKFLDIEGSGRLSNLNALTLLRNLESLMLSNCKKENDYSILKNLQIISELYISGELKDIKWIKYIKTLKMLRFDCKLDDGDLNFLYDMSSLEFALFRNKRNYNVKLLDIQNYLESKGYNQVELRNSLACF